MTPKVRRVKRHAHRMSTIVSLPLGKSRPRRSGRDKNHSSFAPLLALRISEIGTVALKVGPNATFDFNLKSMAAQVVFHVRPETTLSIVSPIPLSDNESDVPVIADA